IAAVKKWIAGLDKKDLDYEHQMMEALWVHQYHNFVDVPLLKRLLGSKEFRARAAATRVLCYWRDRVPGALDLLKRLAADRHPRAGRGPGPPAPPPAPRQLKCPSSPQTPPRTSI